MVSADDDKTLQLCKSWVNRKAKKSVDSVDFDDDDNDKKAFFGGVLDFVDGNEDGDEDGDDDGDDDVADGDKDSGEGDSTEEIIFAASIFWGRVFFDFL